jgi:hypothetical protein
MRRVPGVIASLLLIACEAPRWGEGGMTLPGAVGAEGVTLHLHKMDLEAAGAEVREAITAGGGGALDSLGETTIDPPLDLGDVSLELDADGLVVAIAIAETILAPQESWGRGRHDMTCEPRLGVGPGTVRVPLSFSADALGRLDATLGSRAAWQGPLAPAPDDTCTSDDIQAELTARLLDATAGHVASRVAPHVTAAIGGRLPTRFGAFAGPGSDAALRARAEAPVTRVDDGLAVHFSLQVVAETADCLAPLRLVPPPYPAEAQPPPADNPARQELRVPAAAVQLLVDAFALGGGACGWRGALAGPFDAGSDALGWPAPWRASDAISPEDHGDAAPTIILDWQPEGLPAISATGDGALAVDVGRVTVDVYLDIQGAHLRVATVVAGVTLSLPLEVGEDGAVALGVVAAKVEIERVDGALLPPPEAVGVGEALRRSVERALSGALLTPLPPGFEGAKLEVLEGGAIALRRR